MGEKKAFTLNGDDHNVVTGLTEDEVCFVVDTLQDEKIEIVMSLLENGETGHSAFSNSPNDLRDLAEKFGEYLDKGAVQDLQDALLTASRIGGILKVDDERYWEELLEIER